MDSDLLRNLERNAHSAVLPIHLQTVVHLFGSSNHTHACGSRMKLDANGLFELSSKLTKFKVVLIYCTEELTPNQWQPFFFYLEMIL